MEKKSNEIKGVEMVKIVFADILYIIKKENFIEFSLRGLDVVLVFKQPKLDGFQIRTIIKNEDMFKSLSVYENGIWKHLIMKELPNENSEI